MRLDLFIFNSDLNVLVPSTEGDSLTIPDEYLTNNQDMVIIQLGKVFTNTEGKSAYFSWKENGHPDGTEAEFVEWLKGPAGTVEYPVFEVDPLTGELSVTAETDLNNILFSIEDSNLVMTIR